MFVSKMRVLLSILFWLGLAGGVQARLVVVQTTDFGVLFLSDIHLGGAGLDIDPIITWAQTATNDLAAVVVSGDLLANDVHSAEFISWSNSLSCPVYACLGNHESDFYAGGDMGAGVSPFSTARGILPYLRERGYGMVQVNSVRVLLMNDLADTTVNSLGVDINAYRDCNPPGEVPEDSDDPNPDWSGITDTTSAQCVWAAGEFTACASSWVIPVMHRSPYPAYEDNQISRCRIRSIRDGILAKLTRAGMDLCFSGDVHVTSVTKRLYKSPQTHLVSQDNAGTHFITLHASSSRLYEDSPVDMPGNSFLYTGVDGAVELDDSYGLLVNFYGDLAFCQLYRYDVGDAVGSVVWSGTVNREDN